MNKKTPRGTPAISYRDLMAGKTDPDSDKPSVAPDASPEASSPSTTEPQRNTEGAEESQRNSDVMSTSEGAVPESSLPVSDVSTPEGRAPKEIPAPPASSSSPVAQSSSLNAHDLPPARRRDRSRELTPRELAAVLNTEQVAAAKRQAEIAAAEARAAEEELAKLAEAAKSAAGGAIAVAQALNAPIIEDAAIRHSTGVSSETMEFAVAAATATLPFRDRVRARAGHVEALRFRIGSEFFATDLAAAEEALERPDVHRVPEMPDQMLGVFSLRGKLIPVFSPTRLLGASLSREFAAAVVLRGGDRRIALAIDDVDDVMTIDLARLRDIPTASDPEGVLLAVAWHGTELVSLIDAEALLAACQAEQLAEMA